MDCCQLNGTEECKTCYVKLARALHDPKLLELYETKDRMLY